MSTAKSLTSTKPYLLRAFYEWITDNGCTPYLIINAEYEGVEVPTQYIDDGRIVLNISESAVRELEMNNIAVEFDARFGGVAMTVYAPIAAVMAVYAHENGRGMVFSEEDTLSNDDRDTELTAVESDDDSDDEDDDVPPPRPFGSKKPTLRVIK